MRPEVFVATVALVLFPIPAIVATAFLWGLYLSDKRRPRSWLLFRDAVGMTIIDLGSLGVAAFGVLSIFLGPFPAWTVLLFVGAILMSEIVPIYFAVTYWRVRHGKIAQPSVPVPDGVAVAKHHRSGD